VAALAGDQLNALSPAALGSLTKAQVGALLAQPAQRPAACAALTAPVLALADLNVVLFVLHQCDELPAASLLAPAASRMGYGRVCERCDWRKVVAKCARVSNLPTCDGHAPAPFRSEQEAIDAAWNNAVEVPQRGPRVRMGDPWNSPAIRTPVVQHSSSIFGGTGSAIILAVIALGLVGYALYVQRSRNRHAWSDSAAGSQSDEYRPRVRNSKRRGQRPEHGSSHTSPAELDGLMREPRGYGRLNGDDGP
jgi:hypothetical protein